MPRKNRPRRASSFEKRRQEERELALRELEEELHREQDERRSLVAAEVKADEHADAASGEQPGNA